MLSSITFESLLPTLVLSLGVILGLWFLSAVLVRTIRKLGERLKGKDPESATEVETWTRQLTRTIRRGAQILGLLTVGYLLLRAVGLGGKLEISWEGLLDWLGTHGLRIALILGAAYVLNRVVTLILERLPALLPMQRGTLVEIQERRQRINTISHLLGNIATTMIAAFAGLIALRELGFDITPILTGLGIGGLALGFGAQNLVRDFISGFFIILENQVGVGDVAIINGKGGLVQAIRLRTIVLRGLDGTVHVIPNGSIEQISNMTQEFSYYVIDLGVAYKEDMDRVADVVRAVGRELRADPAHSADILDDLEILGVDDFADSAVILKIRIKTMPIKQWSVGRELRRRIKKAFDAQGIEIPFPHLSLYTGEASKPFPVQVLEAARTRA